MLNQKFKTINPFWLIVLSIVFGLTLPVLIQDAMFQDAMLYSSVSHNLGIGIGTFWFPQYSTLNLEGIPSFHEQPPLVFGIQALFFKLLGNSIYVERFYTFLMIVLHIILINLLWKEIFKSKPEYKNFGWLPVLFWIIIPVCFWSYRNNMIENTLSVFTLSSILISYKIIKSENKNILLWIISGLFIFFASFSKGVPGFFPITFPFIYWLITKKISLRRSVLYCIFLIAVSFFAYSLFIFLPESRHSLSIYFYDRLINRVNTMPTAEYRLEIAWRLFTELIPVLFLSFITYIFANRKNIKKYLSDNTNEFLLFFLIGLSASLPLTLTMVQKGWYLVPSFPYFAIAFAIVVIPIISKPVNSINVQKSKYTAFVISAIIIITTVFTITFFQKDKISREREIVTDVYKIGKVVPRFSTMTVPLEMYDQYDFILQGFLVRYFNISISPYKQYEYFLSEKTLNSKVPDSYKKLDIGLIKYKLYKTGIQK
jgi:4-amino-4-deoxy-L-arabinose transferase-like glycosyltransferase